MRKLISTTVASLAAVSLAACIQPQDDKHPIARAIPTAEEVQIKLPDASPRTVGELSEWYVVTRDVTRMLNGGTAWVLIVVHAIVQYPPTSQDGNRYTWGPWADPLDPAEYKLDVTDVGDGTYDWALSGRSKIVAGAGFEVVISGNAVPSEPEGQGNGNFTIDFDASERVNPIDNNARGVVTINYDLAQRHLDMAISTVENRDGVETPVDFEYTYDEAADRSGDMTLQAHADCEDAGPAAEDALIHSRWQNTGAGRSDIRLSGGDMGAAAATASQCWNTSVRTVYETFSLDATVEAGNEADCAFATEALPPL